MVPSYNAVKRRLVLFFPGFEPLGAEAHRGRFAYAADKTGKTYGVDFSCSALSDRPSGLPGFSVSAKGSGWQTDTDVAVFDWSHILERFEQRNVFVRLFRGILALVALIANGTLTRYLRTSWRYGFFFFYPLLLLTACASIGLFAGAIAARYLGLGWPYLIVGIAAALAAFYLASRQAHLLLMMDDWDFADRVAGRTDADIEALKAAFAKRLASECTGNRYDEVLVIGHSLGCVFAINAMAASGLRDVKKPSLMTVGSSLLKVALHPKADWLRHDIGVLTTAKVQWLDVQSLTDVISFFRSNPATSAGVSAGLMPKTTAIRFKHMLLPDSYRRGKFNLFRTHRQFVLGAERRYFYSMHMIVSGPIPFTTVWKTGGLPLSNR